MNLLDNIYHKSLEENDRKYRFWVEYLENLKNLNLNYYTNQLKASVLVPIGNRILFRGELIHTNEITVALGANYFAKCSTAQAETLREHRIADATKKMNLLKKEREYFVKQMSFNKEYLLDGNGHEIIEPYVKENEDLWQKKHRENIKKYKKQEIDTQQIETAAEKELWDRLEELELQEELEEEYMNMKEKVSEDNLLQPLSQNNIKPLLVIENKIQHNKTAQNNEYINTHIEEDDTSTNSINFNEILNRQKLLEQQLLEIKNREISKNEEDLIAHLDAIEQLELIEDEMDRIDGELQDEKNEGDDTTVDNAKNKKIVTFSDENDTETLELNFIHSDVQPCEEPHNPKKGIEKPSDVYIVFNNLFDNNRILPSILRKSIDNNDEVVTSEQVVMPTQSENYEPQETPVQTILIKDITEKIQEDEIVKKGPRHKEHLEITARPQSLFKMRRSQRKS